jgi:CDP-diacylglycerol--glycerol-3-phosphate 3-phosphatidyltransferase
VVDLACSIGLVAVLGALVVAYAGKVLASGAARFDRVERDQGSVLFGARVMQMGYWGLDPIGRSLAALGVRANAISTTSLVLGLASAAAIATGHFGVAAAFAVVSAVCDALDGMVARHTKTASDAGEVLDASIDRYVEFTFLGALAIHERERPVWLAMALAAILGSFMVSYATAKAEAMGVVAPRGAMRRAERAAYLTLGAMLCPFAALWVDRGGPAWASEAPLLAATALVAVVGNASAVRRLASVARSVRATPGERPSIHASSRVRTPTPAPRGSSEVRRVANG